MSVIWDFFTSYFGWVILFLVSIRYTKENFLDYLDSIDQLEACTMKIDNPYADHTYVVVTWYVLFKIKVYTKVKKDTRGPSL